MTPQAECTNCEHLRNIRELLIKALVRATGVSREAIEEAPFGAAVKASDDLASLRSELQRLREERQLNETVINAGEKERAALQAELQRITEQRDMLYEAKLWHMSNREFEIAHREAAEASLRDLRGQLQALVEQWQQRLKAICSTLSRCDGAKANEVMSCINELSALLALGERQKED
jgi:uncharacterized protein (DUF3084 family)